MAPSAVVGDERTATVFAGFVVFSDGGDFAEGAGHAGPIEKKVLEFDLVSGAITLEAAGAPCARIGAKKLLDGTSGNSGGAYQLLNGRNTAKFFSGFADGGDDLLSGHCVLQ